MKRRVAAVGLPAEAVCNHSFRGDRRTGITNVMENGGEIDVVAGIAGHSSTKTTQVLEDLALACLPAQKRPGALSCGVWDELDERMN